MVAVSVSITGKGTKAQILMRFLSNADWVSDKPGALVPSVLGQVDHISQLQEGLYILTFVQFLCRSTVHTLA